MFTYAGYVTVNLSNHNCNGKFYNISGQKYKGNYEDLIINIYVYVHVPRICNCKHIWGLTQPQLQRQGGSKKNIFSLGIPTHNKPHFMRCGRICPRLYDLYKSPVGLFRVGRPGAIAAGRRVGRELDPRKDA